MLFKDFNGAVCEVKGLNNSLIASGTIHTVKRGETLGGIARKYHVTTSQLMRWNGIKNPNKLKLGQKIRIEGR